MELQTRTWTGKRIWIRTIGQAEFERSVCVRIFGTCQDITAQKEAEIILQNARSAAESGARAKADFLSTMSHEIRTPMSGVIGMASLLAETELDENQRRYVDILNRSGENLLNLINDILDFSRIESGNMVLVAEPFDAAALCHEAVELFTPKARSMGLIFDCTISPQIDYPVVGDEMRLRQVLNNLVGNAVKFTKEGGIALALNEISRSEDSAELEFIVIDSGVGIPKDKLQNLFQPFVQADTSVSRQFGGTGLGLAICHRIVTLMRGSITLESDEGKGSRATVKLKLPLAGAAKMTRGEENLPAVQRYDFSALVVDDDPVIRNMLVRMLEILGVHADIATNGAEAVEKFREKKYAFVTMDTNMPKMNGPEAIKRIRALSQSTESPVIVSVSAAVGPMEKAYAAEIGANDILRKPFTIESLRKIITQQGLALMEKSNARN